MSAPTNGSAVSGWRRSVGILTASTVGIGAVNYLFAVIATHLLTARQFSIFGAGQGALLVLGTASLCAIPWAVARYVARTDADGDPLAASHAMHFGLVAAGIQAAVVGPLGLIVGCLLGGWSLGIPVGLAGAGISLLGAPIGFLQGRGKLRSIAAVRITETLVRVLVGLGLVLTLHHSPALMLAGFPVGAAVALGVGLVAARQGFPLRRADKQVTRHLTQQAVALGAIQVLVAVLCAMDTVYVVGGHLSGTAAGSYQTAALIGRIPLFFSAALSLASYAAISQASTDRHANRELMSSLRIFGLLCVPFLLACEFVPTSVFHLAFPSSYDAALPILRISAVTGIALGALNVVTTLHQARGRFTSCTVLLTIGAAGQAVVLLIARTGTSANWFAAGNLVVCVVTLLAVAVQMWIWLRREPKASITLPDARGPQLHQPMDVANV